MSKPQKFCTIWSGMTLKGVSDISARFLHTVWNDEVLKDLKFPSELKLADIVPAFKKEDSTLVEN